MDPATLGLFLTYAGQIVIAGALVALVRKHVPRIDGWPALVLALVASVCVVLAMSKVGADLRELATATLVTFIGAAGGTAWADQRASKGATTTNILPNVTEVPPSTGPVVLPSVTQAPQHPAVVITPSAVQPSEPATNAPTLKP